MKKNILILSFAFAAVFFSCKKEKDAETTKSTVKTFEQLQKANWLIGAWGSTFPDDRALTETWIQDNDSTFSAKTFFVAGKDTLFSEIVSLEERVGKLSYIANASGQNQGKPVAFKLTSATDVRLVFENAKHDYPKKITYNKFENDSISAEIWGMQDGKEKTEVFPMKKLK